MKRKMLQDVDNELLCAYMLYTLENVVLKFTAMHQELFWCSFKVATLRVTVFKFFR